MPQAAGDGYQDGFGKGVIVTSGTVLSTDGKGAAVPGWFSSVNTNHRSPSHMEGRHYSLTAE